MTIQTFINAHEYFDRYYFCMKWQTYTVYDVWRKSDEGTCIGYPNYALEKDGIIRLATFEETCSIMNCMDCSEKEP